MICLKIDMILMGAFVLCALVFFYIFVFPQKQEVSFPKKMTECYDGETKNCTVNNLPGEEVCIEGEWSTCRIRMVCIPGTREPCTQYGCVRGYKVCNEWGSGYGECINTS